MASNQPYNQELGTYFQNGLRSDILKIKSPLGYGVPLSPIVNYIIVPEIPVANDIVAEGKISLGDVPLNTASPLYVPGKNGHTGYIQFDCLRCVQIWQPSATATLSQGAAGIITLTGTDDRGVVVSEKLTFGANDKRALIISNKAYMTITKIESSGKAGDDANKIAIQRSGNFFGLPYFAVNSLTTFLVESSNITSFDSTEDNNAIHIISGLNFRKTNPNTGAAPAAECNNPTLDANKDYGDARGLFYSAEIKDKTKPSYDELIKSAENGTIFMVSLYVHGADSELNAKINPNTPIESVRKVYQRVVTNHDVVGPNVNGKPSIFDPTELTQFDVFGVQYPGDMKAYNQTFGNCFNFPAAVG